MTVHGIVARVIDTPSQGISYLRIEVPIESHAELTRLFYGKPVLVMPAGPMMSGQPYGIFSVPGAGEPPPARQEPPRGTIKAPPKAEGLPGGRVSREAAGLCNNPDFMLFAYKEAGGTFAELPGDYGPGDAAQWLRDRCGIESRAELDHTANAAVVYMRLKREFSEWREEQAA